MLSDPDLRRTGSYRVTFLYTTDEETKRATFRFPRSAVFPEWEASEEEQIRETLAKVWAAGSPDPDQFELLEVEEEGA